MSKNQPKFPVGGSGWSTGASRGSSVAGSGCSVAGGSVMGSRSVMDIDFEVKDILDRKEEQCGDRLEVKYLVSWKGFGPEENTWESEATVGRPGRLLVKAYEKARRKRLAKTTGAAAPSNKVIRDGDRVEVPEDFDFDPPELGFPVGFEPDKVLGATKINAKNEMQFVIMGKGTDELALVAATEANVRCPQLVIDFYEERLQWHADGFAMGMGINDIFGGGDKDESESEGDDADSDNVESLESEEEVANVESEDDKVEGENGDNVEKDDDIDSDNVESDVEIDDKGRQDATSGISADDEDDGEEEELVDDEECIPEEEPEKEEDKEGDDDEEEEEEDEMDIDDMLELELAGLKETQ